MKTGKGFWLAFQWRVAANVSVENTQAVGQRQTSFGRWYQMGDLYPKLAGRISYKESSENNGTR